MWSAVGRRFVWPGAESPRSPPSTRRNKGNNHHFGVFYSIQPQGPWGEARPTWGQTKGESMMKRLVLAVAIAALGVTAVLAQSDPIAARKQLMKDNGAQSKVARDMIDGKEPYDNAKAQKVLAIFAAAHDKGKNLWPDNSKTGGDTASLPAIWEN